jgi:hypothetical protein
MGMAMNANVSTHIHDDLPKLFDVATRTQLSTMNEKDVEIIYLDLLVEVKSSSIVHVTLDHMADRQSGHCSPHFILTHKVSRNQS